MTPIKSIKVDAEIIVTEIDYAAERQQEVIKNVHLEFPVVGSWREFLSQLDAEKTWCAARDEVDLSFALVAHVSKTHFPATNFEFGPGFVESLRRNGAWGQARFSKVVLATCAGIITSQTTIEIGPFYRDPNNEIQATKDGGVLAWRAHVTKGGIGLRLMFWKSPTGEIEFSRVGPKNELKMD